MHLSIVIPVFNESSVIGVTLEQTTAYLERSDHDHEILCVDDGSTDSSREEINAALERDPRIRLIALETNRGKGAAVRAGVLEARGEAVFFLDADLSTPLEEIEHFLPSLRDDADIVLGNRKSREARIGRRQPILRESLGRIFTLLSRLLLAPPIQDFTCGFKGFRGRAAHEVFRRSTLDGWAFDAELIVIARALRLRVRQLPVTWSNCPKSKVRVLPAVISSLRDLARLFWRRLCGFYRRESIPRGA